MLCFRMCRRGLGWKYLSCSRVAMAFIAVGCDDVKVEGMVISVWLVVRWLLLFTVFHYSCFKQYYASSIAHVRTV